MYKLGAVDLVKILLTPDAKDLISEDGLRQVKDMMGKFIKEKPKELTRILRDAYNNRETIQELIEAKARKEGIPVDAIKRVLNPIPTITLMPGKEQPKTE